MVNGFFYAIVALLVFRYGVCLLADWLNVRSARPDVPAEFIGYYDQQRYAQAQRYLWDRTRWSNIEETVHLTAVLFFFVAGGFPWVDSFCRSFGYGPVPTGLLFVGILAGLQYTLTLPFEVYSTFGIEQRYGFNKTSVRTFFADMAKGIGLTVVIGGWMLWAVLWFFERRGAAAWFECWIAVTVIQLLILFFAPVVILPLFNKFVPLPDSELRRAIHAYAASQGFSLQGVFTVDGSRRTTKANAFFTGFGRFRRIALYDTLIARHSPEELVSVLAHEIGHYKKHHVLKMIFVSLATTAVMFYLLGFFLHNPALHAAFGMPQVSVYAGLVFFSVLFAPVQSFLGAATNALSRHHEYEADRFAASTQGQPQALIAALKKLSVDNLSNLTPHPFYVLLHGSHPPVLARIRALAETVSPRPEAAHT
ncbi:MAG: M48 family metallopeptidase [Candidatus Omnitrophica bacterium]|nr:M48 family metallopeptidase [Candidatus Omnitrophota bacterium]